MAGGLSRVTADGVLGTSGSPVRVFGMSIESGATGGVVVLRNGTAVTDNPVISAQGSANATSQVPDVPAEGIYFSAGLYVDIDANTTAANVEWRQEVR